jgi:hypothetical protein
MNRTRQTYYLLLTDKDDRRPFFDVSTPLSATLAVVNSNEQLVARLRLRGTRFDPVDTVLERRHCEKKKYF